MLFNSIGFFAFLLVTLVVFYSMPFKFGRIALIISSCLFYMAWNPRFIILLFIPTIIGFYTAHYMTGASERKKLVLLLTSLIINLGILGVFKYYNFFVGSLAQFAGVDSSNIALSIVLPVGISFYIFNTLSYTIDVYRGVFVPVKSIIDFSLFIVFFPHLVAGPIVRASDFLPQVAAWKRPSAAHFQSGVDLVLIGLIKKMIFADQFALAANEYFNHVTAHPGALAAWSGLLAFTMQIYFDFSGYTDIARGCARLFGFEFKLNFARPYLALNITEFWHRWHISLSSWLRDYLYISLGGNRHGTLKTYRNLMITMLLGGLWHGASWNFVIWGGFHGGLLVGHKLFVNGIRNTSLKRILDQSWFSPMKLLLNMFVVMIAWIFFRANQFADSQFVLTNLFQFQGSQASVMGVGLVALVLISAVLAYLEEHKQILARFALVQGVIRPGAYAGALLALELFAYLDQSIPFVYFQF